MKQCVLQNILKVNPIYSAGCPKREAACSSEYTEEEGDTFFSECCEDACDMFCRQSSRRRYYVPQGTMRTEAVCSSEYPEYSCSMFSALT